jgi:DNA replication protein DnaC
LFYLEVVCCSIIGIIFQLERLQLKLQNNFYCIKQHYYDLLILDDFGITTINESQKHYLFTIIDDRYKVKFTIITSQLPSKSWHN